MIRIWIWLDMIMIDCQWLPIKSNDWTVIDYPALACSKSSSCIWDKKDPFMFLSLRDEDEASWLLLAPIANKLGEVSLKSMRVRSFISWPSFMSRE